MVMLGGFGRVTSRLTYALYLLICLLTCLVIMFWKGRCNIEDYAVGDAPLPGGSGKFVRQLKRVAAYDENSSQSQLMETGPDMPLIFIGGVPRSGTTLMRAMLDAHPDVRCGEETRVIPRILGLHANWKNSPKESKRLLEAGLTDDVLDSAIKNFILEIIIKHGKPAPRLCNKDPFTMKSAEYLGRQFPNAKFILMIRDGRATVHSIISRKVTITGFDLSNYRQCLEKWNQAMATMYHQCYTVGEKRCFPMYYEQLVLHPRENMKALLEFLEIPWNETVLHHEMFIGNEISLSKTERSSDQVVKPVNIEALTKWVGHLPSDVVRDMPSIAPMLAHLGYDPNANPPNYGQADPVVLQNTAEVRKNARLWREKIKEWFPPSEAAPQAKDSAGDQPHRIAEPPVDQNPDHQRTPPELL